ncbi:MAG: DUF6033 family protein [Clostridium sp.]|nr:DUF6033 family protein [Clostridium sp.]
MAVKIGNSYVSQQAYDYAKAKINSEQSQGSETSSVLQDLSKKYPETTFAVGTQPFSGKGTNNISIAPNILRKMENDPEARLEYEALIYDCANFLKDAPTRHGNSTEIARGYIIGEDGGLRMWGISRSDGGEKAKTYKKVEKDELKEQLKKIREKKAIEKKAAKKAAEKKAAEKRIEEKTAEKITAEKKSEQKTAENEVAKLEGQTVDIRV